ncbi:MAG: TlpA family protein disulfide reductase [Candidatus Bipolaricaulia bacterium]
MSPEWIRVKKPAAVVAAGFGLVAMGLMVGHLPSISTTSPSGSEQVGHGQVVHGPEGTEASGSATKADSTVNSSNSSSQEPNTGPRVGQLAPDFAVKALDGEAVRLHQYRGRPVLMNVWATYCPFCEHEMPMLDALNGAHDELLVLGLNVGEAQRTVRAFAERVGVTYPLAIDRTGEVAEAYQVTNLPTTFLIDAEGVIVWKREGSVSQSELQRQLRQTTSVGPRDATEGHSTSKEEDQS